MSGKKRARTSSLSSDWSLELAEEKLDAAAASKNGRSHMYACRHCLWSAANSSTRKHAYYAHYAYYTSTATGVVAAPAAGTSTATSETSLTSTIVSTAAAQQPVKLRYIYTYKHTPYRAHTCVQAWVSSSKLLVLDDSGAVSATFMCHCCRALLHQLPNHLTFNVNVLNIMYATAAAAAAAAVVRELGQSCYCKQ
eukprot:10888-Heterococcus_DN1.PRE.3